MKYLDHMPWVPLGETQVRQTESCWTNGYILDAGTPGEGVKAIRPQDVDLAKASPSAISREFVAARQAKERGSRAQFMLYYPAPKDDFPAAVLVDARLDACPANGKGVAYFMRKYPGCAFYIPSRHLISGNSRAIGIFHNDKTVGCLMPLDQFTPTAAAYLIMADAPVGPPLEPEAGGQHD